MNKSCDLNNFLITSYVFFTVGLSIFVPLASFFLAITALVFFTSKVTTLLRWVLGGCSFFSLLIIIGSRSYADELAHDLSHYYLVYQSLLAGNYYEIFSFGDGIEIGWPLVYLFQGVLFGEFSNPISLSILNMTLCFSLFFYWIESKLFKIILPQDKALVLGLLILFLSPITFGYLQRQALSVVIGLYALTASSNRNFIFLVIVSGFFHMTIVPMLFFYKLLLRNKINLKIFFLTIIFFLILRYFFYNLVMMIEVSGLQFPGIHKLQYYINLTTGNLVIASKRFALLELFMIFLLLLRWRFIESKWKNIALVTSIIYLVLLGLPLLSERLNFIVFYLYGFFLYLGFSGNIKRMPFNKGMLKGIALFYLVLFSLEHSGLVSLGINSYWQRYDQIVFSPFLIL